MGFSVTDITSVDSDLDVTVLDVGHGNAAVVRDGSNCAVIDAAPGDMVLTELERTHCSHIEHLIISHSDSDHAGGGPSLILDDSRTVGTVWFNPDSEKQTKIWERLLRAVHTRVRRGGLRGHQMLHTEIGQELTCGRARLEVRHPSILMAGMGPTSRKTSLGVLETNTLSIVIRVHLAEMPAVLLAADIDAIGFKHMLDCGQELAAPVLVFPHHGGLPGHSSGVHEFAKELVQRVQPKMVVFSIRSGHRPANPNLEILRGVREGAPNAHIACTQLSTHCHQNEIPVPSQHLAAKSASGRKKGRCCAGTITVTHTSAGLAYDPPIEGHRAFVVAHIERPACMIEGNIPRPRAELDKPSQP
ncbi:competence protein ComEC [Micromonospora luteifusca]|uniref:Competence protein ComEC n=1 Tax=Micromonospora luteifusca TaxID=709860 RepID=A0ABS2LWY5_9ACTN|nr:competence protein ComEC [Micromonospora luteifusca]